VGEKIKINKTDIPASPAQIGMPDISSPNALPNNNKASTYSFIFDLLAGCSSTGCIVHSIWSFDIRKLSQHHVGFNFAFF